jgi:hypothetical protein
MSDTATPGARFHHVANGTSTTRLIVAAGLSGSWSIWADPLHDGPVPAGLSDDELMDVRRRHLGGEHDEHERGGAPHLDPVNDLRRWRTAIAHADAYDELVLWFEHDLFDQLNLIQLLPWIHDRVPREKAVSLVCIGSFPGRSRFKGLGELTPSEIASLFPARARVTGAQYALAQRAWDAFRAPAPTALDDFRQQDTSALPFLAAALTRFIEEYPWTSDGLTRSERRLLQLASQGPIALDAVFPRMHDDERAYYITDLSLIDLVRSLARTTPPLLSIERPSSGGRGLFGGSVAIADAGRQVLAGTRDRTSLGAIDRWMGGVHLQPGGDDWRWDADRGRIIGLRDGLVRNR